MRPDSTRDQSDHLEIVNFTRTDLFKVWSTKAGVLYIGYGQTVDARVLFPQIGEWLSSDKA